MATSDDRKLRSLAWLYGLLGLVYDLAYDVLFSEPPILARWICGPRLP